jgi:cbb3-type cytochrome oxidase cytochrome c subunit
MTEETGPFAAGRQVFVSNNCTRCHGTVAGEPAAQGEPAPAPGRRMRGPNLATVGAKRNRDWLQEHIRNPKAHTPDSRMPAFDGKIADADLVALVDYLASLK